MRPIIPGPAPGRSRHTQNQFSRTGNMVALHSRASRSLAADTSVVLHYHGGRHSTWQVAVEIWRRRHALVSFADSKQIVIAAEVAQSFGLDNGAFSVWKQGIQADWPADYKWVEEWRRHPGFDWAIIPDVMSSKATRPPTTLCWLRGRSQRPPVSRCGTSTSRSNAWLAWRANGRAWLSVPPANMRRSVRQGGGAGCNASWRRFARAGSQK